MHSLGNAIGKFTVTVDAKSGVDVPNHCIIKLLSWPAIITGMVRYPVAPVTQDAAPNFAPSPN